MIDDTTTHKAESAVPAVTSWHCRECGHCHTPDGCVGDPTPSDLWAGVSSAACDCDAVYRPGMPDSPGLSCSALWSRNQGVSCCVDTPHTVHRGSSEPGAPSWGDGECVPGTLTAGRGGR